MRQPFHPWTPDHLAVLALTAAAAGWLGFGWKPHASARTWARVAAALLFVNETAALWIAWQQGHPRIPLQLCDIALFLSVWALWGAPTLVMELAYFWGLSGSLQALLTPDLHQAFPDYWWIKFFITHSGAALAAVYLGRSGRVAPTPRSLWRVWGLTNVYAACVGIVNGIWGMNYGYLAHKPSQPSLLDQFGPWPWYLLSMEGVALLSMALCYAPFALRRAPEARHG